MAHLVDGAVELIILQVLNCVEFEERLRMLSHSVSACLELVFLSQPYLLNFTIFSLREGTI